MGDAHRVKTKRGFALCSPWLGGPFQRIGEPLELESRGELQNARTAATQTGISLRDVRGLRGKTARAIREAVRKSARCNETTRQRELGVIEDVEEFGAKLKIQSLVQWRIFRKREICIPKPGAVDGVAA